MLDSVIGIVRKASTLMQTEAYEIRQKSGVWDIVTSSDIAVQEFLCCELAGLLPGCGFICEEEGKIDRDKEYVWVIDPIDGTTNYSRGSMNCCISVGLMHNSELILGVVYSPGRQQLFSAEKGKGAFLNGKPIKTSGRTFEDGMCFCALSHISSEYTEICSDIVRDIYGQCNDIRRYGSAAIEICLVASGLAELYFEIKLHPWDFAGASVVLREAGGVISSIDGQAPSMDAPGLIAAANNKENHDRLLSIVKRHFTDNI